MEINNLDNLFQEILQENIRKTRKNLCSFNETTSYKKRNSQILDTVSLEEEIIPGPTLMKTALEALNMKDFIENSTHTTAKQKLLKIKEFSFGFRTKKINSNDPSNMFKGEVAVFGYKYRKLFLVCFKKEMVVNKILDNFNKIIDYVSQELSNSLNCILLMLQMLQSSSLLHHKLLSEFVNPAFICSKFLTHLKNELSDICDIFQDKIQLVIKEFNLKDLALEIMNMFHFHCESKGITITLKYDERIPHIIKSDPRFIGQILTSLISKIILLHFLIFVRKFNHEMLSQHNFC